MELEVKTDSLFLETPSQKKIKVNRKKNKEENETSYEAKQLDFKMNMHNKNKYKKEASFIKTTQSFNIEDLVVSEMAFDQNKQKTWKTMHVCDKWKLIKDYISKHQDENLDEINIKKQLLSKQLVVDYDPISKTIKSI